MLRQCKKCGQTKEWLEFKTNAGCKDGITHMCKECAKAIERVRMKTPKGRAEARKKAKSEAYKQAQAKYRRSPAGKAMIARYKATNAAKIKARSAVNHAIRDGKLSRPDTCKCACGTMAKEYHHHLGYDECNRLEVIPVCEECHGREKRIIA